MSKKPKGKDSGQKEKLVVETSTETTLQQEEVHLDELTVKIKSLRLYDEDPKFFAIKITFMDQPIISDIIKAVYSRDNIRETTIALGSMRYDPSDYEKMSYFADYPLVVYIQPTQSLDENIVRKPSKVSSLLESSKSSKSSSLIKDGIDVSCCNVDILPIFLDDTGQKVMCVKKRMEPMQTPTTLFCKSWDCLPLLTMEISVTRDTELSHHHQVLKEANWMKVTLIAMYNMIAPYDTEFVYTAASKMPICCESNTEVAIYNRGYQVPRRFNCTSFYPKWESLRVENDEFTRSDEKLVYKLENIQNEEYINVQYYITEDQRPNTAVWGSFHRTLMLNEYDKWFMKHIKDYKWPIEVHMYAETGGYSFMGFINLFKLLYPGEKKVCAVVPLTWVNATTMIKECDCDLLLTPNDKAPDSFIAAQKSRIITESVASSGTTTETTFQWPPSGGDENNAFVIIEVELGRALENISIPRKIYRKQINEMLKDMEKQTIPNRECTGRGQLNSNWEETIGVFATSLRRVPYYGTTDICTFNRQLCETRTRVELMTSSWLEASVYINNNFVIQQYLQSEETYEELLMMSHACLMRTAVDTLFSTEPWIEENMILKAARHARQMQDTEHAIDLYLQLLILKFRDASNWRELSTCLKDIDREWANVCLNKAVVLDPRHPLTLLSKGSMLFEEDPATAEPFFVALLAFYPFWTTLWIIASAYYYDRGLFHMADTILHIVKKSQSEGTTAEAGYPRVWERELGDWWDNTPLLPGTSLFLDAADLLFRLRALPLAEVCVARALTDGGETASYYHQVALACHLRGKYEEALCHLRIACEKFGELTYLRSLEGECHVRLGDFEAAKEAFNKAGTSIGPYCTLLSLQNRDLEHSPSVLLDLLRRQPSAYSWMAFADSWVAKTAPDRNDKEEQASAKACARECAVQALRWDRRAGNAWALLAKIDEPSEKRAFCHKMAKLCGFEPSADTISEELSKATLCKFVGTALRECRCDLCEFVECL